MTPLTATVIIVVTVIVAATVLAVVAAVGGRTPRAHLIPMATVLVGLVSGGTITTLVGAANAHTAKETAKATADRVSKANANQVSKAAADAVSQAAARDLATPAPSTSQDSSVPPQPRPR